MRHWLRLARIPFAPTAILDALVCGWFALQVAGVPPHVGLDVVHSLWLVLACTAFYVAGMASNDYADRHRDVELAPTRPIPCGAIRPAAALALVLVCAAIGLLTAGLVFGWIAPLLTLTFIGLYNGAAKHAFMPGVICMGMVRASNASIVALPVVAVGAAPVWVLLAPLSIGLYSAAITVMSTTEDADSPPRQWLARLMSAGGFTSAAVLAWVGAGNPVPTFGVIIAFGAVSSTIFGRTPRPGPAKRMVLEMLLGLYFLEYVIATAAYDGSLVIGLAGVAVAYGMIYVSRVMIRALFVVRAQAPESEPADES